jgi:hypothetical protein
MTHVIPKDNAPQDNVRGLDASEKRRESEYAVGYGRPPVHSRFKKGQSGNPKGRRKGSRNLKTEIKQIVSKPVTVRDGETERKVSMAAANVLAHGVKGAKGDVRSANLFLNVTRTVGLLEEDGSIVPNDPAHGELTSGATTVSSATALPPSEILFANLDLNLLTREDIAELSRLAEVIDMGGDFTALGTADFERVKLIVNKGRGKDVTPP